MSGNGTLKSFAEMFAQVKMPERVVPTCLRGDLAAEHEQLNEQLERLEKDAVDSLAGNGGAEIAEQIRALEADMRDSTYPIRLRGLPRAAFLAFLAAFPARRDDDGKTINDLDRVYGFDTEAGFEPLVRQSIVDPELSESEFADLLGKLTMNQFDNLVIVAWQLNKNDIDIPFSRAASRLNRLTGGDSKPPTD